MIDRLGEVRRERIQFEIEELRAVGVRCEAPTEIPLTGSVEIVVFWHDSGRELPLSVTYPDSYPYFRFVVRSAAISLDHHQNPFDHNLCLLGRRTAEWNPSDTVKRILESQLPKLLQAGSSSEPAVAVELEERQAEPWSTYYPLAQDGMVLSPRAASLPTSTRALRIKIGLRADAQPLWGLLAVEDDAGQAQPLLDAKLAACFPNRTQGILYRLEEPPRETDAGKLLERVGLSETAGQWAPLPDGKRFRITGIAFPEETEWREQGTGLVFIYSRHTPRGVRRAARNETQDSPPYEHAYIRAGYLDMDERYQRVPDLQPLSGKKIAVVGLGCLGAPSALEFARAGCAELRVLDHDFIDPATSVRWPFGVPVAGLRKAGVIAGFVQQHYPYTTAIPINHRVGDDSGQDLPVLARLLDGVDLLFDASAEEGVQYFLATAARERGIPYVCAYATSGGWGGTAVVLRPTGPCWNCFKAMVDERNIPELPALSTEVQPAGCAEPTFTGSNFDLAMVVMSAVRMAVAELCDDSGGYKRLPHDVVRIALRDVHGAPTLPEFTGHMIVADPACGICGR